MTKKIAILGYGRAGKDTCGAWLGSHTPLVYAGSTSSAMAPSIAASLGMTTEAAWADRHNNRQYWRDWCDNYRKDDPTLLARLCLEVGDMIVGLRAKEEFDACRDQGVFDIAIWIDRPGVSVDPTVGFSRYDCDVVIDNDSSLNKLFNKLDRLCTFAGIPVSGWPIKGIPLDDALAELGLYPGPNSSGT